MAAIEEQGKALVRGARWAMLALVAAGVCIGYFLGSLKSPSEDQVRVALYKACANSNWFSPTGAASSLSRCSRQGIDATLADIYDKSFVLPIDSETAQKYEAELLKYKDR